MCATREGGDPMHTARSATTKPRAWPGWLPLAIFVGMTPISALARDICVQELPLGATYVFSRVKTLRPRHIVPLTGARVFADLGNVVPVDGTAVMRSDGTVIVGVLVHNMSPSVRALEQLPPSMSTDADFAGTGTVDANGDFFSDGPAFTWTKVDCSSFTIP